MHQDREIRSRILGDFPGCKYSARLVLYFGTHSKFRKAAWRSKNQQAENNRISTIPGSISRVLEFHFAIYYVHQNKAQTSLKTFHPGNDRVLGKTETGTIEIENDREREWSRPRITETGKLGLGARLIQSSWNFLHSLMSPIYRSSSNMSPKGLALFEVHIILGSRSEFFAFILTRRTA